MNMRQEHDRSPDGVSIAAAAKKTGVHRRTIERWIRLGRVRAWPGELDKRERLVSLEEVESVAQTSKRRSVVPAEESPPGWQAVRGSTAASRDGRTTKEHDEIIARTLDMVLSHHQNLGSYLHLRQEEEPSPDELRQGRLGQILVNLSRACRGETWPGMAERTIQDAQQLLAVLFWAPAESSETAPPEFWEQPLGKIVAGALKHAYGPGELLTPPEAADALGVGRGMVSSMLRTGEMEYFRNPDDGSILIPRRSVEFWQRPVPVKQETIEDIRRFIESEQFQHNLRYQERLSGGLSLESRWYFNALKRFTDYRESTDDPPTRREQLIVEDVIRDPIAWLDSRPADSPEWQRAMERFRSQIARTFGRTDNGIEPAVASEEHIVA